MSVSAGLGLFFGVAPGMSLSAVPGGNVLPPAPTIAPSKAESAGLSLPKRLPSFARGPALKASTPILNSRASSSRPTGRNTSDFCEAAAAGAPSKLLWPAALVWAAGAGVAAAAFTVLVTTGAAGLAGGEEVVGCGWMGV